MLAGNDKDLRAKALESANKAPTVSPSPSTPPTSGGFSANASFGGANISLNRPATTPGATPAAGPFGAQSSFSPPAQPMMSSLGKPMPVPPEDPEL